MFLQFEDLAGAATTFYMHASFKCSISRLLHAHVISSPLAYY